MSQRIEIKKKIIGGYTVGYDCPKCGTRLTSPLEDAGKPDSCPDCAAMFKVPGQSALAKIKAEEEVAAQQKSEQQEQKRIENEQKAAETAARRKVEAAESAERRKLQSAESSRISNERMRASASICTQCGIIGKPVKIVKGSFLIEVILWLFMCLPGVIYSIWRLTSKYEACPQCRGASMIPLNSPRGKKLEEDLQK